MNKCKQWSSTVVTSQKEITWYCLSSMEKPQLHLSSSQKSINEIIEPELSRL